MAHDNFIFFRFNKPPAKEDIQTLLEDYFGPVMIECYWNANRFFVTLLGTNTHPMKRQPKAYPQWKREPEPGFEGRHLEVIWTKDTVDVLTRDADAFTNDLALGLAKTIALYWKGELGVI